MLYGWFPETAALNPVWFTPNCKKVLNIGIRLSSHIYFTELKISFTTSRKSFERKRFNKALRLLISTNNVQRNRNSTTIAFKCAHSQTWIFFYC